MICIVSNSKSISEIQLIQGGKQSKSDHFPTAIIPWNKIEKIDDEQVKYYIVF